jgi:predicted AlkP superfamily phosphohydrolase/phosphomutase
LTENRRHESHEKGKDMGRTVLFGIDGATYGVLDPLMEEGVMPCLQQFVREGVRAELRSGPNRLTPAEWTSMVTGRNPGAHGIFDFVCVERIGDMASYRLATSRDVKVETIWSMATRHNRRVISLNFPVMYPPRPLNGCMIPGFVPQRHLRRAVYPSDLLGRLSSVPGLELQRLSLDFEEERRDVQVLAPHRHEQWIEHHIAREEQWFGVLRHLMIHEPWDLLAIVFDGADKLQHACWRFLDPDFFPASPTTHEHRIRDLCLTYFRRLDEFLAQTLETAGSGATVLVVSDHGFGPTHQVFYANAWLRQQGLLDWEGDVPLARDGMLNTEGTRTATHLLDWSKTNAFALTAGSNGIYLRVAEQPGMAGIPPGEYEATRQRIVDGLLDVRHPISGEKVVADVLTREHAFPGDQMRRAPDLTLTLSDYGFLSVLNSDQVVKPRAEVAGTHRPNGIFMARGPDIRVGAAVPGLSILDIAPLMLHSLGLPVDRPLDGRLPTEVYRTPALDAGDDDAVVTLASELPATGAGLDAAGEEVVLARLRTLGYLE